MDPYLNLNNSGASNLTLGSNELTEAAVVLNGYTGQYGRQAGANVNYVTKSGTNDFHGNALWYWNGNKLNANDWFNNAGGNARPHAVSNEWADSFGGPIIKNKLFFFVDNEGLRYVLPNSQAVYVPTGDFATYVQNNINATNPSAAPFYQNIFKLYAGAPGSAGAQAVTAASDPALGCGNFVGGGFGTTLACSKTYRTAVNNLNTEWLLAARADYNFSAKDRIYFRYNTDHGVQATGTDPINSAFNANSVQPSYGGQFGYTRVISATMVNQLNLAASYYKAQFGPPNLSNALSTFPTTLTFSDGSPFNNLGGSDNSYPEGRNVRQWQLVDDYSILHGSHTIKFGVNVRKNWVETFASGAGTSGLFTFTDLNDFVNGTLANGSNYSQSFSNVGAEDLTLYSLGFYGQDEWKIRQNLTVTMALRLDRNSNIKCSGGCFNELSTQPFSQADHSAAIPYNAAIQTGLQQAFPSVEPIVAEPRVGIAYSPNSKTVIRGGFGIFSDLYQGLIADRLITNSPGVAAFTTLGGDVSLTGPTSALTNVSNSNAAFRNGFANGATVGQLSASVPGFSLPLLNSVANKLYNPKYYEWNFEIQQALTPNYVLSANYVGNHGYQELNQSLLPNAYATNGFAGLPTTALDPRFGEVRQLSSQGWSNYDGLVGAFKWRVNNSFSGQFSYTWSHALDTCSNECLEPFNATALGAPSIRYAVNPFSLRSQAYGSADYDVRHSINANYVYTLPNSFFHNGVLKQVLGGWTVAGTFFYHSGYPFSVVDSDVRSQLTNAASTTLGNQTILADALVSGSAFGSCSSPGSPCLSSSQFLDAASQHDFGNLSRNSFRGAGYFDTDLNLNKTFALTERFKLLVGAFFFNILNHPNFDLPPNNLASGTFGQIQETVSAPTSAYGSFQGSAVSGRVIQMQVKLTF